MRSYLIATNLRKLFHFCPLLSSLTHMTGMKIENLMQFPPFGHLRTLKSHSQKTEKKSMVFIIISNFLEISTFFVLCCSHPCMKNGICPLIPTLDLKFKP